MEHENKQKICNQLLLLLRETRAGLGLLNIIYTTDADDEWVTVIWGDKYQQKICVTADSGIALISDVLKRI